MKALTKGQYEGIGRILRECKAEEETYNDYGASTWLEMAILTLADQFQESDPEFKRELFIKQCGVTE